MFSFTCFKLVARRPSGCVCSAFNNKLHMALNGEKFSYEEAIKALNSLQTNAQYMKNARHGIKKDGQNVKDTSNHLKLLGIESEDINALNVIHVSGTKGKGSTCAFTESILRHHGVKTGFYSSPHLMSVAERIRINGQPIERDLFAMYFWKIYDTLNQTLPEQDKAMPPYFHFLTLMAYYIFVKEKIEAAIIEVGIGGLYDCTNVVSNPVVVGVTTLGYDHMHLLGNTIEQIAAQKAGIFKPNVTSFTVTQEDSKALIVLREKSNSVGCPLSIAPSLESYQCDQSCLKLGIPGRVQSINASLALQLSHTWLKRKDRSLHLGNDEGPLSFYDNSTSVSIASPFSLSPLDCQGLESCVWDGRFQTMKKNNFTFYLDGAHTIQSMRHCIQWFAESSQMEEKSLGNDKICRILLFNCTGNRNAECLLNVISELPFDLALFTTNIIFLNGDPAADHTNFTVFPSTEIECCKANKEIYSHMIRSYLEEDCISSRTLLSTDSATFCSSNGLKFLNPDNVLAFACINDLYNWLQHGETKFNNSQFPEISPIEDYCNFYRMLKKAMHCQILVTGSIHLVGNVLSVIRDSENC